MSVLDFADQLHRYSHDEYAELISFGAFRGQRVELIDGLILKLSPKSGRHEKAVAWLHNQWLGPGFDFSRYEMRICGVIATGSSEPEPDIAILDPDPEREGHPTTARLVIEVAVSSRDRDLALKPRLYAAVTPEYWVVDLDRSVLVVHREPVADGYREVTIHGRGAVLKPQQLAIEPLVVAELLDAI